MSKKDWIPKDNLSTLDAQYKYSKYIKSKAWKKLATLILERDKHQCRHCKSTHNLHVHHISYKRLGKENHEDLVSLCKRCHESVHALAKANKSKKTLGSKLQKEEVHLKKLISQVIKKWAIPIKPLNALIRYLDFFTRTYVGRDREYIIKKAYLELVRLDQAELRYIFINYIKN